MNERRSKVATKKQIYNELFKRLKKVQLTAKEPEIGGRTGNSV
jgi:hypothetical protein